MINLPSVFRNNRENNNYVSLFDDFFNFPARNLFRNLAEENYSRSLNANVKEENDKFIVQAEVPGLEEKDIDVSFSGNSLTIKAEYKDETKNLSRSGSWSWVYYIQDADSEKIEASLKNGVLKIEIPKIEKSESKKIIITN